jgi:hypothetical protein
MTRNCHVPFWRAVEEVTSSLTLIIKNRAVGHSVLKAHRVSEAIAGFGEKPTLKRQLLGGSFPPKRAACTQSV